VVAKVRERLEVSKQAAQKFDGERFNLRKLNELEVIRLSLPTGLQLGKTLKRISKPQLKRVHVCMN